MRNTKKSKLNAPSKITGNVKEKVSKSKSPPKMMKAKVQKKSSANKGPSLKGEVSDRQDIVRLILEDHKPLKKLIRVLKNRDLDFNQRQDAFNEFAPLLLNHSKSEEQSLYIYMKDEDALREEGFEGDVEHALADQLVEEIRRTDNDDLWSAKVQVLADLVENHIEEEENKRLSDFKKYSEIEDRIQLGQAFLRLKSEYEALGGRGTVAEDALEIHPNH